MGLSHRRRLYDAEISELSVLLPLVEAIVLILVEEDQIIWLGDKKGLFSVKAAYEYYTQAWPHRVGFFLWQAYLGRLPTMKNLHCRQSHLDSSVLCKLCNNFEESVDHLLINCTRALSVWNYFLDCAKRYGAIQQTVKEVICGWKGFNFSDRGRQLWKRLPAAIMWGLWLWKARNAVIFNGKIFKLNEVIRDIKIDAFN
ncbi:hypothetical protein MKW98_011618 [Papaver atlanticum]|uniref:Reverse transcriptase zinc-binding domain-containing protein n=1 Tax=Papaver atlanticum TaxID=357466 RepID=A0AAD4S7F6_9MAGN|nr:hypothetical protein MKW98_011618 [Papaver atlanticum]